jgi:hypothetical protein
LNRMTCASQVTAKQGKTRAKNGVIDCWRESRRLSPSAVDPRPGRVVVLQMRGPRGGDGERGTRWGTDFTALNAAEPAVPVGPRAMEMQWTSGGCAAQ